MKEVGKAARSRRGGKPNKDEDINGDPNKIYKRNCSVDIDLPLLYLHRTSTSQLAVELLPIPFHAVHSYGPP